MPTQFEMARSIRVLKASLATLLLCVLSAPVAAQTNATLPGGASSLQESFENWTVACIVKDANKHCALAQQQTDQQSHQRVLAIEVAAGSPDRAEGTLILPFGLLLDKGIALQVDDTSLGPALRFRTCIPAGCILPLSFDAKALAALRKGTALKVNAVAADGGKDMTLTISLKGFPAGFDRANALAK